ncbi:type IV secretion system DNA-binding domain-containing protein [Pseudofrankia sp. BMG5.37]|uniref:type IV secretion system DNA-binding domain-containing protein n=1 Tax=Pseudofrankia sp. BMG5.37 TaxID=3050035 RepID=UPI0028941E1C|nr:type IV secretion system DNA-binding domain-containing protein [Pseudofrankia sp. BMG5.37]MDT3438280.1 type IV secretion system DNA-binding domain-containing protein [Pseudofrankia sp. BMG5.37]
MSGDLLFWISVIICGLMTSAMAGILALRMREEARWHRDLAIYALRFPRGVEPLAVVAMLTGLSGLAAPWWRRAWTVRGVVIEVSATAAGIAHHLLVRRVDAAVVLAAIRAAMPDVAVTPDGGYEPPRPTSAVSLGLSTLRRPLDTGRPEVVSTAMLASLQPLAAGERLVMQWALMPARPTRPVVESAGPGSAGFIGQMVERLVFGPRLEAAAAKDLRAKQSGAMFVAAGRIGATARTRERAGQLVGRMNAAMHTAHAPGVSFYRRRIGRSRVAADLAARRLPVVTFPLVLNTSELAALAAFPLGSVMLPGLRLGGTRQLAPSADIPMGPRTVARSTFPGAERPLGLSVTDSLRHLHVIGPTGVGKSTLLLGLITQDIAAGRGVVVLDPKGDLVADVLDRVPQNRRNEVVILDPADEARPVGLNLLSGSHHAPELVADQVVGIFHQLYKAFWGPRTDDILRAALLTLATEPGMTLTEVPLILTDAGFRRRLVAKVDDPVALGPFWAWYEGMSDAERAQAIGPVMNKLRAFLLRRRVRNVLGQAAPRLDLAEALAHRRIVLVPLTKGVLGEEAAALVGSLVVARVWQATLGRSAIAVGERPTTFLYADEFQDFVNMPQNFGDVLAQARGLGLGMTLAHQHLGQLPSDLREAVLANARSRVIFQTSATDAGRLAKELAPHLGASDLQGLGAYEVVVSLSAGSRVAPPATGVTLPPPPAIGQAALVRAASRQRWGQDRGEVEAAIRARHEGRRPAGRVGRREVSE